MRCPVGAIHITSNGTANVNEPDPELTVPAQDDNEFLESRAEQVAEVDWSEDVWTTLSELLAQTAADLKQGSYYPLVANLFTAAGYPAWKPPSGDTSNRIDLILASDSDSLPVEVKSRTESTAINVKSVQQALENRVVLDERQFFAANPTSSTLVVGFDYPAPRSGVTELVDDIAKAFEVNIGLISLSDLYGLALQCQIAGVETPRTTLSALRGELS
jgi:Holliday junction resolvase-like predicted endonuclease